MSNANEILRGSDRSDALLGSGAQRQPSHHRQSCASCGSPGGPGHVLKACIACHKVLYCNVACQKLHWKEHKEECYAFREQKKEEWRQNLSRGLLDWGIRHERAFNQAGSEVLLPSKADPTRNLLQSHALEVIVNPATQTQPQSSSVSLSDFVIRTASTMPLGLLKKNFDDVSIGQFERQLNVALASPAAVWARIGKGLAGVMWIVTRCEKPRMFGTRLIIITQEALGQRPATEFKKSWMDDLKTFTAPGVRGYKLGNDGFIRGVRMHRTRRTKAKLANNCDAERKDESSTLTILSPTATSSSSTILSPRWTDMVDDDDGELPDLSNWAAPTLQGTVSRAGSFDVRSDAEA
ncbi:hypothetical protein FRB93_004961 [Tulasnella sp. JGI-2019a]|nr:hypothetical protein FRB93_004961 [Tulasnella sp. JGI-2019a]